MSFTSFDLAKQESNYTILMYLTAVQIEMGEVITVMEERSYDQPSISYIVKRTALLNPTSQMSNVHQWLFLVPVKGGRWHIIPQLAVYTTYILPSGGYMLPTTFYGNQKQPLSTESRLLRVTIGVLKIHLQSRLVHLYICATPGVCPGVTLTIRASTIINYHGINYHHFRVKVLGFRF